MKRKWVAKAILLVGSTVLTLCVVEVFSRFVYPISANVRNVTLDGETIENWLTPGTTYRQIASEFDVITTITEKGHRGPEPEGNPDVVFIGDSFTFGWGLADEETFASLYCRSLGYSCANLGSQGTGTIEQVDILDASLRKWGWRPKEVKLFIFAMTASFLAGNDLADNFNYERSKRNGDQQSGKKETGRGLGVLERIVEWRRTMLAHSNLLRIAKYHWGPTLRSMLSPGLDEERLNVALDLTSQQLERLAEMSRRYGFDCSIYLLHPMQDIIRGTHNDTLNELNAISPITIQGTGQLFVDDPELFYYAYDGHLNRNGSRTIARFLVAHENTVTESVAN